MKTIYKYPIKYLGITKVDLPKTAIIRHVGLDMNNDVCIWVELETTDEKIPRFIYGIGTGFPISPEIELKYIDSIHEEEYVWHFYEIDAAEVSAWNLNYAKY